MSRQVLSRLNEISLISLLFLQIFKLFSGEKDF